MNKLIFTRRSWLRAGAAALVAPGQAWAQQQPNLRGRPAFGSLQLQSGFQPDPRTVEVRAGGPDAVQRLGQDCVGFIDFRQPDVNIEYRAARLPLILLVRSNADTTLVVNLPDGSWRCNDDFDGVNPGLTFEQPQSGLYNVWIGTFESGALQPASLVVTEIPPPPRSGK
jgi:hypothetical protein